jgi:hypothetical protein
MTAISRRTAQQLTSQKVRTEAKNQPGPVSRQTLQRTADSFKQDTRVGLQRNQTVAAKLGAALVPARAELASAGAQLTAGAGMVAAQQPELAKAAQGLGDAVKKLAADPSKAFGPFSFDLGSLVEGAKSLVKTAESVIGTGVELIKSGAELVTKVAGGLDSLKELAIDELRKSTIDGPIDNLNSPGDSVKINLGGELLVPTPIPDLKAKGAADVSAEIKRDDDGGYTISTEGNVALGASVGVEDPELGNSGNADLMLGVGGKMEFKVPPVLNPDGSVNEVATKAKVKELTEAIARAGVAGGAGPLGAPIADKLIGPTAEQKALMKECFKGVELKGSAALALAGKLNLPMALQLDGTGKVQEDVTLRIEKGDQGLSVSMKTSLSGEAEINGARVTTPLEKQTMGTVKGTAKVELEQKFEFPGSQNVQDVIANAGKVPPIVTQTLTLSTDVQGGYGSQRGGQTGVADGTYRDSKRLGVTTEVKITAPSDPAVLRQIVEEALKGNLADAARKAGDNTEIELKATVYTERNRQVAANVENESVGGAGGKGELVERDVIKAPQPIKTTPTQIADTVRGQLDELNRLQKDVQRSPVYLRA